MFKNAILKILLITILWLSIACSSTETVFLETTQVEELPNTAVNEGDKPVETDEENETNPPIQTEANLTTPTNEDNPLANTTKDEFNHIQAKETATVTAKIVTDVNPTANNTNTKPISTTNHSTENFPFTPEITPEQITTPPSPTQAQLNLLAQLNSKGIAPSVESDVWLNSEALNWEDLRGKVVIVEFWTYG